MPVPVRRERLKQRLIVGHGEIRPGQYDQVQTAQVMLMPTETFPNDAFDAIAGGGPGDFAARYGQPEPGMIQVIVPGQHQEEIIR